jgi:hypothetical protein
MKRILFVGSEPKDLPTTECISEYDDLQEVHAQSSLKQDFTVEYLPRVSADKLIKRMRKIPPHYIHYCGHGNADGVIQVSRTEDGTSHSFGSEELARFLRRNYRLECVVFCSCHSEHLIEDLQDVSNYLFGFRGKVDNETMRIFTREFYTELFEVGSTYHAYLNMVDNMRAKTQRGNYLIFKSKVTNDMKKASLIENKSVAEAKALDLGKGITSTDNRLSAINQEIEDTTGAYTLEFYKMMETHPAADGVIWFSNNKDALAVQFAYDLYQGKSEREIEEFVEDLKLLFFGFEALLLYYEDETAAIEIFEAVLSSECPPQDYLSALEKLNHVEFSIARSENFQLLYPKAIATSRTILTNLIS